MNRLGWSLVCVLALGVSACDGGNNGTDGGTSGGDAGMTTGGDGGGTGDDAGGPPAGPPVQVVTMRDSDGNPTASGPADYSCNGSATAPAGSGDSTFTVTAKDFQTGEAVTGLMVQFFPDNMPSTDATCSAPCQAVTTDASGQASVTGTAGGWYAYRVIAGTGTTPSQTAGVDYIGVVQINEVTPDDGGSATLNVVSANTRNLILTLLPLNQDEGTAVITGEALDCNGDPVQNATVKVFDSTGEIALGTTSNGPRAFYFNGMSPDLPQGSARMSAVDGLYGAANVPLPTDGTDIRLEIWGSTSDGAAAEMLGCEHVQAGADGVTILNVGPTRSDGPTDCSG